VNESLALIEVGSWSVAMVLLDTMDKASTLRLVQAELNDGPGVSLKLVGALSDLEAAASAARRTAALMGAEAIAHVIAAPADSSRNSWEAPIEFNPLIEQVTVSEPSVQVSEVPVSEQASYAIGLIETQGFTAVFEAIDTAVKTAAVEVLAREKLGGGYITVVIKGDVAAVQAAVAAGSAKVASLGRLVAAHVIPRPSEAVLSLLPGVKTS
jgi:carbon dioxide concentrating mechanism protein CcmO